MFVPLTVINNSAWVKLKYIKRYNQPDGLVVFRCRLFVVDHDRCSSKRTNVVPSKLETCA